jgi:hypothetical protein
MIRVIIRVRKAKAQIAEQWAGQNMLKREMVGHESIAKLKI